MLAFIRSEIRYGIRHLKIIEFSLIRNKRAKTKSNDLRNVEVDTQRLPVALIYGFSISFFNKFMNVQCFYS